MKLAGEDGIYDGAGVDQIIYASGGAIQFAKANGVTLEADSGPDKFFDPFDNGTFVYSHVNGDLDIQAHTATSHFDTLNLIDLNASDVTFTQNGGDLLIGVNATSHVIRIEGELSPGAQDGVQQIAFANGTIMNHDQIAAAGPPSHGT